MPLANCNTCGKDVAVNAEKCPRCGADDPSPSKGVEIFRNIAGCLIIVALFVGGYYGLSEYFGGKSTGVKYVKKLRSENHFIKLKALEWTQDELDPVPSKYEDESGLWKWAFRRGVKQELDFE